MKLRTRLLLGFAVIFAVVIAAGFFTVAAQRNRLYQQIDDRLIATPLPQETRVRPGAGTATGGQAPRAGAPGAASRVDGESISDLYVAVLTTEGLLRPMIEGQLLTDVPDLEIFVEAVPTSTTFITTAGVNGTSTFRAVLLPGSTTSLAAIVAVPVDGVDDAIRQLSFIFLTVAGVILLVLILIASWVSRLGLRPLTAMTDVSEAISSGERHRRADVANDATEAGRLGHAFNVMLDERDNSEARLRQFVSNASHELRTPLTSIRGYVDLYQAGGFRNPGELDDAMRRLEFEAERMNRLVEDLLVLAKFDEEHSLDISKVLLNEMIVDVVAFAIAAHPRRDITIDAPTSITVDGDHFQLHQALTALVDNAVQHTPEHSTIQVAASLKGSQVVVSVVDSGHGLTASEADVVFDRFSRGDRSRTRKTGGSGLGLSITQAIVHAHGGEITVTSTPGQGATFTITLPT